MVVKVVARPAGHAGHAMGGEGGGGFVGGAGTDGLTGSACDECVLGGGGSDTIGVGAGVDYVDGGAGRDTISLGADADQDYVFVGAGESARANYDTWPAFVIEPDATPGSQGTASNVIAYVPVSWATGPFWKHVALLDRNRVSVVTTGVVRVKSGVLR